MRRPIEQPLSRIIAEDLASYGATVNLLLPGGATETEMVPKDFPAEKRAQLLRPEVMEEATLFLCSDEGKSVHDERIAAKEFAQWKTEWLGRKRSGNS